MRAIALWSMLCVVALEAFPGVSHADEGAGRLDHPPKIAPGVRVEPAIAGFGGPDPLLRSRRITHVRFLAEDPDDEALTYTLAPLPAGASFDQQHGILTWQPTREQEGKHEVSLEVSDGHLKAKQTYTLFVIPNRPPADSGSEAVVYKTVRAAQSGRGEAIEVPIPLARDPDGDDVTFAIRKVPPGGRVVVAQGSVVLLWSPTAADIGEHELVVEVSDGELRTTIQKTIVVMAEWEGHDYRRWFLLGGGPSAFLSHGDGEAFLGGTFDVTLVAIREDGMGAYACTHGLRSYDCHASHHRFYGQFEVLDSMRSGAASLFTYAAGYSASLEWRPARRYLIPHYGIDVGGLVRAKVGHRAQVHAYLGVHLWTSDSLWVDATLGYRVTPAELVDLSGPTFGVRAVLNPW